MAMQPACDSQPLRACTKLVSVLSDPSIAHTRPCPRLLSPRARAGPLYPPALRSRFISAASALAPSLPRREQRTAVVDLARQPVVDHRVHDRLLEDGLRVIHLQHAGRTAQQWEISDSGLRGAAVEAGSEADGVERERRHAGRWCHSERRGSQHGTWGWGWHGPCVCGAGTAHVYVGLARHMCMWGWHGPRTRVRAASRAVGRPCAVLP
jgi:hypothetical protein